MRRSRTIGREDVEVHTARHDGDAAAVGAHADELEHLVGAGGDDPVGRPGDVQLDAEPLRRARVGGALVAALDDSERVEGLRDRDPERPCGREGGDGGHPEVRVDDRRACSLLLLGE
jgi:hypothetical protein